MDWIYKTLVVNYGIILNKPSHSTTKNGIIMYRVLTTSKKQIKKIYNLFYNTNSSLYLKRKKEKFETALNIPRDSNSS